MLDAQLAWRRADREKGKGRSDSSGNSPVIPRLADGDSRWTTQGPTKAYQTRRYLEVFGLGHPKPPLTSPSPPYRRVQNDVSKPATSLSTNQSTRPKALCTAAE